MDPYQKLQQLLPTFLFNLGTADVVSFIEKGFISRRFVLRGRFQTFGYTRIMRTFEDTLLDSFLRAHIPKETDNPLYFGDAVGGKTSIQNPVFPALRFLIFVQSSLMASLSHASFWTGKE
jgi:hypothetical protein